MGDKGKVLCKWSKGRLQKNQKLLREIVESPKWVCLDCGRAAGDKKWLCNPQKLERLGK